jgi:hypothetical protein
LVEYCASRDQAGNLAGSPLVEAQWTGAPGRPSRAVAQDFYVEFQLGNSAAERIAVHAQLACGLTLVTLVFLQHGKDESLLELADSFRIKYPALVHLQYQGFQLVFHSASLFTFYKRSQGNPVY